MNAKKVLFYVLAVAMGGCLPVNSVYPLYDAKNVVLDDHLLGNWTGVEQPGDKWVFEKFDDEQTNDEHAKAYKLTLADKEGKGGVFCVRLLKLKDRLMMDILPEDYACDPDVSVRPYNAVLFEAMHTFALTELSKSRLRIRITDVDEFEKLLAEHPDAIAYRQTKDHILLTAPTKKLQAFVLKYADDEHMFPGDIRLKRQSE